MRSFDGGGAGEGGAGLRVADVPHCPLAGRESSGHICAHWPVTESTSSVIPQSSSVSGVGGGAGGGGVGGAGGCGGDVGVGAGGVGGGVGPGLGGAPEA